MAFYINGIGGVSPQLSFAAALSEAALIHHGNQFTCQEPDYQQFIDSKQLRRLSRIVKLGVAGAIQATQDATTTTVDGVIVGTGWGCIEDTVAFLQKMVENQEDTLSPTAFIHSTHNTIAAQVGFQLKCRGYNTTYSHRAISFESALLDASLLLAETPKQALLVGGVDELMSTSFDILSRFRLFKEEKGVNFNSLFTLGTPGTVAGEGSVFFVVSGERASNTYCQVNAIRTISYGNVTDAIAVAQKLLHEHNILAPDVLLLGRNGDIEYDRQYDLFVQSISPTIAIHHFKHLCGEYPTASAFGMGMGATLLKAERQSELPVKSVLLYNRSQQNHQTLMLMTAC